MNTLIPTNRNRTRVTSLVCSALSSFAILSSACGRLPNAPTDQPPTLSGRVYQTATPGFGTPLLSHVLITIEPADGSQRTAVTNDEGFYTLSATAGPIAITAAKAGYETKRSQFDLSNDTVLNFSLTRDLP